MYFRSAWEANYARYLSTLVDDGQISAWEYEPHTFVFPSRTAPRSYTPDFKLIARNGSHVWHEVKGWLDDASRARLESMSQHFPEETVVLVGEEWFTQAKRTGLARSIRGWETKAAQLKARRAAKATQLPLTLHPEQDG